MHKRNTESGVGLTNLVLQINDYSTRLMITRGIVQFTPQVGYMRFRDALSGGEGNGVTLSSEAVIRRPGRGEVRLNMELRSLTESKPFSQPEFLVTDGKRFGKSALINLLINYDLGKSLRLSINMTDRIFEDRPAEFTGRGELVARF
jgi:hypothetical protein